MESFSSKNREVLFREMIFLRKFLQTRRKQFRLNCRKISCQLSHKKRYQNSFIEFHHLNIPLDSQNATLTVLPHYDLKNCKRRTYFVHKKRTMLAEYFPLDTNKARVTTLLKHFPVSFENKIDKSYSLQKISSVKTFTWTSKKQF